MPGKEQASDRDQFLKKYFEDKAAKNSAAPVVQYGPATVTHLIHLKEGNPFDAASHWRPDYLTVPFSRRLMQFLELQCSEPFLSPEDLKKELDRKSLLATLKDPRLQLDFPRTTLNAWLSDQRDPSLSSSDPDTRENIYKLCALLELDYLQTAELFEKVFFNRAYDPKDLKELCYRYYALQEWAAKKAASAGENVVEPFPCRWYAKGNALYKKVDATPATLPTEPRPQLGTKQILDKLEIILQSNGMQDTEKEELLFSFLCAHRYVFTPENKLRSAREKIEDLALRISERENLVPDKTEKRIPFDPLIAHILGFSQRATDNQISSLKNLPKQLTQNFPSGALLRQICLKDDDSGQFKYVCTFDEVYKMLCLLLFYFYFTYETCNKSSKQNKIFQEFIRFADIALQQVGLPDLYPRQPYGNMLLYCASQKNPLVVFRSFLLDATDEVLAEKLRKTAQLQSGFGLSEQTCLDLVKRYGDNLFLFSVIQGTLSLEGNSIDPDALFPSPNFDLLPQYSDVRLLEYLYRNSGVSGTDAGQVLNFCTLLPASGVSDALFAQLLDSGKLLDSAEKLAKHNWLVHNGKIWKMDTRLKTPVAESSLDSMAVYLEDCKAFAHQAQDLPDQQFSEKDLKALNLIRKTAAQLGVI